VAGGAQAQQPLQLVVELANRQAGQGKAFSFATSYLRSN
jgi:hypothetical protein